MKDKYEKIEVQVVLFDDADVITTSGSHKYPGEEDELDDN